MIMTVICRGLFIVTGHTGHDGTDMQGIHTVKHMLH